MPSWSEQNRIALVCAPAEARHLTNELLSQLGRVVERDSNSVLCGPGDLFTALAEDERYWGWFARLKGGSYVL